MDEHKIAFIVCTNDEIYLQECIYYINRLEVPSGYEIEFFSVTESSSMCNGYQIAMKSSTAKYKIYLHQDTFLIHTKMLYEMLDIFLDDSKMGLLGVIGATQWNKDGYMLSSWDTGCIFENIPPLFTSYKRVEQKNRVYQVKAIDGLIMMTQYDISWREDIFDGWDYYDISQSLEFQKRGYQAGVVNQKEPWCYHCNHYSKVKNYYRYKDIFIKEYESLLPELHLRDEKRQLQNADYMKLHLEKEQLGELLVKNFNRKIEEGNIREVLDELRQEEKLADFECLKEYKMLQIIRDLEKKLLEKSVFVTSKKSLEEMLEDIHEILFLLKRIEFRAQTKEVEVHLLKSKYTSVAVLAVITIYTFDKTYVKDQLGYAGEGYLWKD